MFLFTMTVAVKKVVNKSDAALAERLRAAGLRPTRHRLLIAGLLLDGRHRHVSADGLAREMRHTGTHMAGGTVYNTLNQFTEAGLLRRVTVHNEHSVFDTNTDHHHHFYDADRDQLIAAMMDVDAIAREIGADTLAFISIDGLYRAMGAAGRNHDSPQFCDACFTGDYPIKLASGLSSKRVSHGNSR